MQIPTLIRRFVLPVGVVVVAVACAGGQSAGWTYAPLGPSANPSAAASAPASGAPASGAPASASASGAPSSPAGSGATGGTVDIKTTAENMLAFEPNTFTVAAGAQATVNYTNDSTLMHNIQVFAGPDNSGESLGATEVAAGPANTQTLTFTAPSQPGDYYFWCQVHGAPMSGTYHVQ
jgi:plastocyanin